MTTIRNWLIDAGLEDYVELFVENEIDEDIIGDLSEDDLRELGLPLGARKRFQKSLPFSQTVEPAGLDTSDAERRQVTVMFCDLVDSTPLAEKVDPEELKSLIESYQDACLEIVTQYDGFVARYSGDGILIYFGYPRAHEGDAHRAVCAALDIVESIRNRDDLGIQVHIGIHTGLVVAGDTREKAAVTGETPNIAARLEGLAGPNEVLISSSTKLLVDPFVVTNSLGPKALKGVSAPMELFQVSRLRETPAPDDPSVRASLPPLVGREGERQLLLQKWARAVEGEAQIVAIAGEPGVGKTRLVRSLGPESLGEHTRINYYCSAFHKNSAFFPITSQLEQALSLGMQPDDDARRARLNDFVGSLNRGSDVSVVLEQLLGLAAIPRSNSQQFKDTVFEGMRSIISALAEPAPLLIVVEDLHWADPSTAQILHALIEELDSERIMMVVTLRPEAQNEWTTLRQATSLSLTSLGRQDSIKLVENLVESSGLYSGLAKSIAEKADGVPLFLEELAKSAVEAVIAEDLTTSESLAVPTSLRDALMARLDALGERKEIVQIASIFGRRFDAASVAAVAEREETEVEATLKRLLELEFLVRRRSEGDVFVYEFRHALLRDLAYESLLHSKRLVFHQRAARRLVDESTPSTEPEVLAWHFEQAGELGNAISQLTEAAQTSLQLFAHSEGAQHLKHALKLLHLQDPSPERDELELQLRLKLGPSLMMLGGYASDEVDDNYSSARRLYENHPDRSQLFMVLHGLYEFQMVSGNLPGGQMLAEEMVSIGEESNDALQTLVGQAALGTINILRGNLEDCIELTSAGLEHVKKVPNESVFGEFGHDPRVPLNVYHGWSQAILGQLNEARETAYAAIQVAEKIEQPASLGFALSYNGIVLNVSGFYKEARHYIDRARQVCGDHQLPLWNALSTIQLGWNEMNLGDFDEGLELTLKGIEGWHSTGARSGSTFFYASVADCLLARGELAAAADQLDLAERYSEDTGELIQKAEILRLRAQLEKDPDIRQAMMYTALATAKEQNAKLWQLKTISQLVEDDASPAHKSMLQDLLAGFHNAETSAHVQKAQKVLS